MTMDFRQVQRRVTLEHFLLLIQTTSRNTTRYHVIFAQCCWFAYTIWTVLQMDTGAHVDRTRYAAHQGKMSSVPQNFLPVGRGSGVNDTRTPATIKLQWEGAKVDADQERDALRQALRAPELARVQAEQALQQERAAREQDQAALQQSEAARQQPEAARRQDQSALQLSEAARLRAEAEVNELRARLQLHDRVDNVSQCGLFHSALFGHSMYLLLSILAICFRCICIVMLCLVSATMLYSIFKSIPPMPVQGETIPRRYHPSFRYLTWTATVLLVSSPASY
ncbi:hypothetical protein ARMSODRAFT_523429 [Armillaria solidipes]|uniref:Uncharacterized protein n=1 Tax=Armillaria solidipes TaxID=1076256 RepID=A0A2H3BKY2_9AGAR|nr:hypothetical protein ARMSODRAFT_523429 [Armillaria solidipes]